MKQYEYKTDHAWTDINTDQQLTEWCGRNGWKLVSFVYDGKKFEYVFIREISLWKRIRNYFKKK